MDNLYNIIDIFMYNFVGVIFTFFIGVYIIFQKPKIIYIKMDHNLKGIKCNYAFFNFFRQINKKECKLFVSFLNMILVSDIFHQEIDNYCYFGIIFYLNVAVLLFFC